MINRYTVFGLLVMFVLTMLSELCAGDCTVTRGTTIQSDRSIAFLVLEAGWGLLNDQNRTALVDVEKLGREITIHSTLAIDGVGRESEGAGSRLGHLAKAAWRLIGFIFWDATGSVSRITDCQFRGRSVRVVDTVSNGRVWLRVTIGPPLGDPRVRCVILTLEANDAIRGRTRILLSCSAQVDLPGDRCGFVRRIASRIAEREAGPELSGRVNNLADAGRSAVLAGRGQLTEIVDRFIGEVCHE